MITIEEPTITRRGEKHTEAEIPEIWASLDRRVSDIEAEFDHIDASIRRINQRLHRLETRGQDD